MQHRNSLTKETLKQRLSDAYAHIEKLDSAMREMQGNHRVGIITNICSANLRRPKPMRGDELKEYLSEVLRLVRDPRLGMEDVNEASS